MITPIDIHTHHAPQLPGKAIVNCFPQDFSPQAGGWYSVGVHPWHASSAVQSTHLEALLHHPQVLAVGEAGLDKLSTTPISLQMEIFELQARLAEQVGKPLIIHLVKATDELLKIKQRVQPRQPWIIHGFRGKATLAKEYIAHGLCLSFGEKYQEEALRIVPPERLFLETDESIVPIDQIYQRAAQARNASLQRLQECINHNIHMVFYKSI